METLSQNRHLALHGTPYQVGRALGTALNNTLTTDITHYLENGPLKFGDLCLQTIQSGAMGWFESLPERFRQEMQGMAEGSVVPIEKIAAWGFADAGGKKACSGFLLRAGEDLWVGRNNDLWVPDLWGYAIERHVPGRLATLSFGMRGEIFAATGLNEAGLWLHYNWLPAFDLPSGEAWTPYVLLTEMLETCQSIDQVETIVKETRRTGGMLIFAAKQNTTTASTALLECTPKSVIRKDLEGRFLAGTNHYQVFSTHQPPEVYASNLVKRLHALKTALSALPESPKAVDLIGVLADPAVEQHQPDYGTVYSNLACLNRREYWFTFGGFPAASRGRWEQITWPY